MLIALYFLVFSNKLKWGLMICHHAVCVCVHPYVDVVQNENKNSGASPHKVCDENNFFCIFNYSEHYDNQQSTLLANALLKTSDVMNLL